MDYILLDKPKLRALVSETRLDILRTLVQRRYTLTELAELLQTTKSNIAAHLDKLEAAGLIEQKDEGRKWKYYALTAQGKELVGGQSLAKPVAVLLLTSLLMGGTILFTLFILIDAAQRPVVLAPDHEYSIFLSLPLLQIAALLFFSFLLGIVFLWSILQILRSRSKIY